MRSRTPSSARPGLTLMELIIVMTILIALAAIIVPMLPGLIARGERAARATNSQEIYKSILTFQAAYSKMPRDWDALVDSAGTPVPYVDGFSTNSGGTMLTTATLTSTQVSALSGAGINRIQAMSTTVTGTDRTFNPYPTDTSTPPVALDRAANGIAISGSSTPTVAILTPAAQYALNLSDTSTTSNGVYVVFGLGKRCSLVGTGVNEAAFNLYDNLALSPDTRYSRYGVVFALEGPPLTNVGGAIVPYSKAKLVRVFRFGGKSLGTGDEAIQKFFEDVTFGDGA